MSWTNTFVEILWDCRIQKNATKFPRDKKINVSAGKSIILDDININNYKNPDYSMAESEKPK